MTLNKTATVKFFQITYFQSILVVCFHPLMAQCLPDRSVDTPCLHSLHLSSMVHHHPSAQLVTNNRKALPDPLLQHLCPFSPSFPLWSPSQEASPAC